MRKRKQFITTGLYWLIFIIILLMAGKLTRDSAITGHVKKWRQAEAVSALSCRTEDGQEQEIQLPAVTEGKNVSFSFTVPDMGTDRQELLFSNKHQSVTVFQDGKQIYEYGNADAVWGDALPQVFCLVPIGVQDGTHQIEIRMENGVGRRIGLSEIRIGNGEEILTHLARRYLGRFLIGLCMNLFGAAVILIAAFFRLRRAKERSGLFFHAGLFILLISMWLLTDMPVMSLLSPYSEAIFTVSFLCFMVFNLPLVTFVEKLCGKEFKALGICRYLLIANCLIQAFLHVVLQIDFYKMLMFTHLLMIATMICMVVCLCRELRGEHAYSAKGFLGVLISFAGIIILALLDFYLGGQQYYNILICIGIMTFSVMLVVLSVKRLIYMDEENAHNMVYKAMAYIDGLTGYANRAAFEKESAECQQSRKKGETVRLMIADINNLKQMNDVFGHGEGDQLIKEAVYCLFVAFDKYGKIFRIGGDEFAVLFRNCTITEDELLQMMAGAIKKQNRENEKVKVSMACGIFSCEAKEENLDMAKLYREADRRMYEDKKRTGAKRKTGTN